MLFWNQLSMLIPNPKSEFSFHSKTTIFLMLLSATEENSGVLD